MRRAARVGSDPRVGVGEQRRIAFLCVGIFVRLHIGAVFFRPFAAQRVALGGGMPVREKTDAEIHEEIILRCAEQQQRCQDWKPPELPQFII